MSERIIAAEPPNDGREWDNQCARCGSSVTRLQCEECGGEGYVWEDDPEAWDGSRETFECNCAGLGGWFMCLSGAEWCEANPLPGREQTKRGELEWFTFDTAEEPQSGGSR